MRWYWIIFLSIVAVSCENQQSPVKSTSDSAVIQNSWMKAFALPGGENLIADSNSLKFFFEHSFDTTFAVYIKKEKEHARYVYYTISPQNKMAAKENWNPQNNLTYFNGVSSKIEDSTWQNIIGEIGKMKFDTIPDSSYASCCDIPYYFVSFNGKSYTGTNDVNQKLLLQFKEFLKKVLKK